MNIPVSLILQALGVPKTSIHLIGVSLGAHVGGLVGHFYEGRLGRITGKESNTLNSTSAQKEVLLNSVVPTARKIRRGL